MMFNSFFSIHQVPREWSKAIVTPVFKSGSSCDVTNYRSISLTCVACKLMDRVVATRVLDCLRMHKLTSKHQHGFLSRHSTVSNLLESVSDWTLALNNGKSVMVAYVDYAKSFDVVCHNKLLSKLSPPLPSNRHHQRCGDCLEGKGETIRSVLCNIVCNNCAQCDAHTYEQTNSSRDWVLSHWAHFIVLDSFLYCVLLCAVLHDCLGL